MSSPLADSDLVALRAKKRKLVNDADLFRVQEKHVDVFGTTKFVATNSDVFVTGIAALLRIKSTPGIDFSSGYVYVTYPVFVEATRDKAAKTYDNAVLIPAADFYKAFKTGKEFARMLSEDAVELAADWKRVNGSPEKVDKRVPQVTYYDLYERQWKSSRGPETSKIEMQLSTFGFNDRHQSTETPPPVSFEDVKVIIKMKQTLKPEGKGGAGKARDVGGFYYDGCGYNAPLSHVLSWLKSDKFSEFCESVKDNLLSEGSKKDAEWDDLSVDRAMSQVPADGFQHKKPATAGAAGTSKIVLGSRLTGSRTMNSTPAKRGGLGPKSLNLRPAAAAAAAAAAAEDSDEENV